LKKSTRENQVNKKRYIIEISTFITDKVNNRIKIIEILNY